MKKTKMLKKNYEFRTVLSKGKYFSGYCIEAFIKENNIKKNNYLGIAIGSKIAKATKRNYIKRLFRETYKELENSIKTGYSIVFLWKKRVDTKKAIYKNVKKDMEKIFDKAEILIEEEQ